MQTIGTYWPDRPTKNSSTLHPTTKFSGSGIMSRPRKKSQTDRDDGDNNDNNNVLTVDVLLDNRVAESTRATYMNVVCRPLA
jgi:hypothetical protein